MQVLILLGAPGAGKGTVSADLTGRLGWKHLSTGDCIRRILEDPSSDQAKIMAPYLERGELVPDDMVLELVETEVRAQPADTRLVLDGFPRTVIQSVAFDAMLAHLGSSVQAVFKLDIPTDTLVKRISGRRVCRDCGAVYHVDNRPPKAAGICDACGGDDLYRRSDDLEERVLNRLKVYKCETAPLISYYADQGLLHRIDATGSPEASFQQIKSVLASAPSA